VVRAYDLGWLTDADYEALAMAVARGGSSGTNQQR
jgi:hypothetical protein